MAREAKTQVKRLRTKSADEAQRYVMKLRRNHGRMAWAEHDGGHHFVCVRMEVARISIPILTKGDLPMAATATKQQTKEGDRVATVGRDGARTANTGQHSYPIWTGKVYEARPRTDGVLTWRLVSTFGGTRSSYGGPSNRFFAELREAADYPFELSITQNQVCE